MTKNIPIFIYLIFYYREIVKLDHFMTLSLSYANTVMWCSRCKIHHFVAAPMLLTYGLGLIKLCVVLNEDVVYSDSRIRFWGSKYRSDCPITISIPYHVPGVGLLTKKGIRFNDKPDTDGQPYLTIPCTSQGFQKYNFWLDAMNNTQKKRISGNTVSNICDLMMKNKN